MNTKINIFNLICFTGSLFLLSCEDLFEPENVNQTTEERILSNPSYAEGLLASVYTLLPNNSYSLSDVATDNAVTNDKTNDYLRMANGQWTSVFNPMNLWSQCLSGVLYVNYFLSIVEKVNWKGSISEANDLYIKRFKGESYGLRAFLKYHLLMTVAGEDANGNLSGIPLLNYLVEDGNFNIPRATFSESVEDIYSDIDMALHYLSMDDYKNVSNALELPSGYKNVDISNYNIIFGNTSAQRVSGRIVKALQARVALLAASPAFNPHWDSDPVLWTKAAEYSGELLKSIGGIAGLDPDGHRFFLKSLVDKVDITNRIDQKEMIWRTAKTSSNTRETDNFPPSFFGKGRINPAQNLVDAFPMQTGYPITHENAGYNISQPYDNRDPRLNLYVMYNNSAFKGSPVCTGIGGKENAKDSISTSTRTGYYLKKWLVPEVELNPSGVTTAYHYDVFMRYTEFFLIYAEAANEAYGPDGDPQNFGFTARSIIQAIRKRAGISTSDNYLAQINKKEDMRALIRNERRLELCFEGFRFWDLRRWKENLNETVRGVEINRDATQYNYVDIETRRYQDYMYSGPLPYQDVIKYNNLIQNKGW
jgi:hypothetical protein